MAETDAQLLYGVGPFGGMKAYQPGVYTPVNPFAQGPVDAYFLSNIDVHRNRGAASTSFGRVEFISFPALENIQTVARYDVGPLRPYWLAQDSTGRLNFYDFNNLLLNDIGDIGSVFTQAVQCDGNMFLNNGQQIYVVHDSNYPGAPNQNLAVAQWQYPKYGGTPTLSKVPFTQGLAQQEYIYAFTVVVTVPTINGDVKQETAPIGANAPYPYHKLVTDDNTAIQIGGLGGGINGDGLEFSIRIYRQSTNQPIWFEVTTTQDATYVDTAQDQDISGNEQLAFSGQVPPVSGTATWPIAEYLDRMWVFAIVQNNNTQQQPQTQLWYSNVGQAWNFDDVAQVLLVGNESTSPAQVNPFVPCPWGREPSALIKYGSLLIAFRTVDTWFVTGQDENTFQALQLFDSVGCIAPASPIVGRGLLAWLADTGFWVWDGSTLTYITNDDVWLLLQQIMPGNQSTCVGFYWQNFFCWSFPVEGFTVRWHAPTQMWDTLPYALTGSAALASVGSNPTNNLGSVTFNQVVGIRPGTVILDAWFAASATDLGAGITSFWQGPVSDAGMAHAIKEYRYVVIEGPPQPGATCTVTVHRDFDQATVLGEVSPWSTIFDLGEPYPWIVPIPMEKALGTFVSVDLAFTSAPDATEPVQIWKAELYGQVKRQFAVKV